MDQRTNDFRKSAADEDHPERSVEEFEQLSGHGNSIGWIWNRDEIHELD